MASRTSLVHLALVLGALIFGACRNAAEPQPAPPPATPAPAAPHHPPGEHAHAAPHGGLVATTAKGHLELVVDAAGLVTVFLLDKALAPRPVTAVSGRLDLAGQPRVELTFGDGKLTGQLPAEAGTAFAAVLSVVVDGAGENARFNVDRSQPATTGEAHDHGGHDHGAHDHGAPGVLAKILDVTCPPASAAACTLARIQGNQPLTLVDEAGERLTITAAPGRTLSELFGLFVGQQAELTGKAEGTGQSRRLVVERAAIEHEHSSHHGGYVAMAGELHLEVMALRSGEIRVYLSDAFRRPTAAEGKAGTVVLVAGPTRSAKLLPDASAQYLVAQFPPFTTAEIEASIRLPLPGAPTYEVTFVLEPQVATTATGTQPAAITTALAGAREIEITVAGGYSPYRITLKRGEKSRLKFVRKDSSECANELLIPGLDVRRNLAPLAATTIELTPTRAGEFAFSCGMDMLHGKLIVTE